MKAFYYGNFNRDHTQWTSYPAEGRYGTTYVGLRNRLSILSEAYSHAPYKTRVLATRDFVLDCLQTAVSHKAEIVKLLAQARQAPARRGQTGESAAAISVPIRSRAQAVGQTGDRARFCRARGKRPPGQDRRSQRLHAQVDERVRGDRVGRSAVRLPDPRLVQRGDRESASGMVWTSRSCARTSSSTSRFTRSTRSRSRLGGPRGTTWSS